MDDNKTSVATFCDKCMAKGSSTKLDGRGKCPECDWEPKNAGGLIGALLSLPVALPVAIAGEATESPKVTKVGEEIMKTSAKVGDELGPPMVAAALGAALLVGAKAVWRFWNDDKGPS